MYRCHVSDVFNVNLCHHLKRGSGNKHITIVPEFPFGSPARIPLHTPISCSTYVESVFAKSEFTVHLGSESLPHAVHMTTKSRAA